MANWEGKTRMTGPLTGFRILEFAGLGPGPFCGMMLADHGAEVIRIGRPAEAAGQGSGKSTTEFPHRSKDPSRDFMNRSKKNISVNLKDTRGVDVVRELSKSAHGVIEGFRPGVMERLGLGPEVLMEDNPSLVYGRMTGWGQDGPFAAMAGHDINYIALSGALHAIGRRGEKPVPPLNLVGDFGGGGMMLAFGMVSALLHAGKTGQGQVVDCAMSEGSAVLMAMMYSQRAMGLWQDTRGMNVIDTGSHYYDTYETSDGKFIAFGAVEPQFYQLMLEHLGLDDEAGFGAQNDASAWPMLKEKVAARVKLKTRAEWCAILDGTDACFAPVLSLDEAPDHPHNDARKAFVNVDGAYHPAPAPRYSVSETVCPTPMQSGEDVTMSVLEGINLRPEDITGLRDQGTIG